MSRMKSIGEETPGETASAISAALEFLGSEARAAGLSDVAMLIFRASLLAKQRVAAAPQVGGRPASRASPRSKVD